MNKALESNCFSQLYSIEADNSYFNACTQRFEFSSKVKIIEGESQEKLWDVIKDFDKPITFWLDAHIYPPIYDGSNGKKNCPLIEELEQIKKHKIKMHTILIDDMSCCGTLAFDYLTKEDLIKKIKEINQNYKIRFIDGGDNNIAKDNILVAEVTTNNQMIKSRILGDANWGTHMPALVTAVIKTSGPVLELGCGDFSTPLLHAICSLNNRYILSVDADKEWIKNFLDLEKPWHEFMYLPLKDANNTINSEVWSSVPNEKHWSVVFIDHYPADRRKIDIERFANNADIIVIHDTERDAERVYEYQPIISKFKYKFIYSRYKTETTLVSNFLDVEKIFD